MNPSKKLSKLCNLRSLFYLSMVFATSFSYAQESINVSGKIIDSSTNTPVSNVNVVEKRTSKGVRTDANGNFNLTVSRNAILVITAVSYETQEIPIGSQLIFNISLIARSSQLNEVIVIGYGQRRRRDVTGAVASVGANDIEKSTSATPQLAMQGRLAGVLVSTPSGNPSDRTSVLIRGVNSFNGVNDPLYVIDGVPITEGGLGRPEAVLQDLRTPINIFSIIDPNDIESISVLKDASAAAIYGVRAANGVILITTKRGKTGKPKIEFSAYYGVQNAVKERIDVLNTQQYVALYKEAYANNPNMSSGSPVPFTTVFGPKFNDAGPEYLGNSPTIDWQKEYLNKNAPIKNISIRVSGANEALNYYVSAGYYKTEGTLKGSNIERYSVATNLTSRISKYIEAGLTIRLVNEKVLNETSGNLSTATTAPPWQPIYDPSGPGGFAPVIRMQFEPNPAFNPTRIDAGPVYNVSAGFPIFLWGPQTKFNAFGFMGLNENAYDINRILGNAYVQVSPLKGLKIKGSLGGDYLNNRNDNFGDFRSYIFSQTPGNPYGRDSNIVADLNVRNTYNKSLLKELTATYNAAFFKDHTIELTAGASEQDWEWKLLVAGGSLFYRELNLRSSVGLPLYNRGSVGTLEKRSLIGYFGRLSYKFADKYYVDATIRRDGSSRFAPGFRWGTFPSVALAWRVTAERFFPKINWLNDLKIRGGWGQLGNDQGTIGFAYLSSVSTSPDYSLGSGNGDPFGTQVGGAALPNFPNKELSWETLTTTGIGFDAVLFNNRINLTLEYYNKTTSDIIQSVRLPANTGIQVNTDLNIGKVRNRGIEIQVGYNEKLGPIDFNVSANFTTIKNEVLKLNGGTPLGGELGRIQEGYSMFYLWGYKMGGIFQTQQEIDNWRAKYADLNVGQSKSDPTVGYKPKPGDAYFLDVYGNPRPGTKELYSPEPDGQVNTNDRTYLGKTIPGYFYGFNIGASYKGFDLSVFFQGVGDVQKYNGFRAGGEGMSSNGANQWTTTLGHWTPQNMSSTMPRAVYGDPNLNNRFSSRFVEDAGYLRLKNLQLGYTFPKEQLRKSGFIEGIRLYVSGINLFTVTQWTGLDPENDVYPPAKQYLFGINASF